MIRFISRFNKEEVYAHIHQEICIKFKLHFKIYLNKTCVAHTLQFKIQRAIYFYSHAFSLQYLGKDIIICNTFNFVYKLKWNAPGDPKMYIYFFMDLQRIINCLVCVYVVVVGRVGGYTPEPF